MQCNKDIHIHMYFSATTTPCWMHKPIQQTRRPTFTLLNWPCIHHKTRHHNHMIKCCTYSGYLDRTTHVYLALNSPWQASCNRGPAAAITLSSSCRFMQIMAKTAGIQHQNLGPVQHHIMTAVIQMRPYQAVDWQDQTYMTLVCKISILP